MAHRAAHHQLPAERTSDGQRPIKWHKQTLTVEPFKNHLARANVATEGAPAPTSSAHLSHAFSLLSGFSIAFPLVFLRGEVLGASKI